MSPQTTAVAPAEILLDAMAEAVVIVDSNARICFANTSTQRLFGYEANEIQGAALEMLLPPSNGPEGLHFESGPRLATRTGTHEVTRARHKSGDEFSVELSVSASLPGKTGVVLLMREPVSAPRAAPTHLEGASVGIVQLDERGEVTYVNDAWRSFIEDNAAHESTCVGPGANYLTACDQSSREWAHKVARGVRALLAAQSDFFELLYDCHSPTQLRWIQVQAQRPPGKRSGVVLTHIDCTSQQLAHARSRIQTCVTNCFASHTSLLTSCRELALIICQELAWDFMAVWLPDTSTWDLRCADVWTRPSLGLDALEQTKRETRWGPERGLPGRVWSSRRSVWISEMDGEANGERLSEPLHASGLRSGFAFAVKYDDDVLAVIEICGLMSQCPDYSLLAWLEIAGVQLATAELRQRAEYRASAAEAEAIESREQLEAVLAYVPALLIAVDRNGEVKFVNKNSQMLNPDSGGWRVYFPSTAHAAIERALGIVLSGGPSQTQDVTVVHPDGHTSWSTLYLGPIGGGANITGALIVSQDVSDAKRAQQELFSAQHMAALGTMAAGVAHEINTPIQFLGDSIDFLRGADVDTAALVQALLQIRAGVEAGSTPEALKPLVEQSHELEEQADLEYLIENVPKAFERCGDGLARVTTIVRSMKEFSHPANVEMSPCDLNRAINATLTVARNEYKYVAELITDFGELPNVNCHVNEINQVVLNIVVNAAHAIGSFVGNSERRGTITVRTYAEGDSVVIAISDTGGGIPEQARGRLFEPFFTTKEVGKGTGLGLALAWKVVKEKHGGDLTFETELGVGTTFHIRLPIDGQPVSGGEA